MKSNHFPDCFYRVSVKGLCVKDGRVLLVKEPLELSGQWELPGGGLDFGEDPTIGLQREVEEEMKLKVTSVGSQPVYAWTNRFEKSKSGMDWYYSLVLCYPIELESFDFTPTPECEEIAFYSKNELQTLDLFHQSQHLKNVFNPSDFI